MEILGYSERGAINALLYEIAFSSAPVDGVTSLLRQAAFANCALQLDDVSGVTCLVEQSLSDFGDADAILLLHRPSGGTAVFLEGKVKPAQTSVWTLQREFERFKDGLESTVSSSNLFAQLYHKVRFVGAATCGDQRLSRGVTFPHCSSKRLRKIGGNPVVLRAVEQVGPFLNDPYYVGLVPDSPQNVRTFVSERLNNSRFDVLDGWDVSRWGFLCWTDVAKFCADDGLPVTSGVLKFNREIFTKGS